MDNEEQKGFPLQYSTEEASEPKSLTSLAHQQYPWLAATGWILKLNLMENRVKTELYTNNVD